MEREFPCQPAESEDSADVGAIGLALEPLAWEISQPGPGESVSWVLGFGFWGVGCWVLGFEFWVLDFGFWVLGFGFWVLGFGFWVLGFGFWILGFGFWVFGFWVSELQG